MKTLQMLGTLLLIDDHALFRYGMRLLFSNLAPQVHISEAANCAQALALDTQAFDLILLDWHMPGIHGMQALEAIKAAFVQSAVIVISSDEDPDLIRSILDRGAAGYVPKSSSPDLMVGALGLVLANGVYVPREALLGGTAKRNIDAVLDPTHTNKTNTSTKSDRQTMQQGLLALTERQREVLQQALRGVPNKLIARALDISEGTVKSHLSSVYHVLNVRNRTEALYEVERLRHLQTGQL